MDKRDYYEVLGVAKTATADEIKKAYRKNTGTFKNFKMKKSTGVVKVKLPKVPAGKNYAIALLKVTDHNFNTSFVCMVGILNK